MRALAARCPVTEPCQGKSRYGRDRWRFHRGLPKRKAFGAYHPMTPEMNRAILSEMLRDEYCILEADNGRTALDMSTVMAMSCRSCCWTLSCRARSGFELLADLSRRSGIDNLPVIMISSEDSDDMVLRAYELGASDYINRPFDSRVVRRRVSNTIRLYAKQRRLDEPAVPAVQRAGQETVACSSISMAGVDGASQRRAAGTLRTSRS